MTDATARPPRKGSLVEWLTRHAHVEDYDELHKQAVRAGFTVARRQLSRRMHYVRRNFPKLLRTTKPKSKPKQQQQRRPTAADMKAAQLRRLVFEMGYDAAAEVFAEFQHMHGRMTGGGE